MDNTCNVLEHRQEKKQFPTTNAFQTRMTKNKTYTHTNKTLIDGCH